MNKINKYKNLIVILLTLNKSIKFWLFCWLWTTQLVRPPLVTYAALCSTCMTYETPCHAIGQQRLPTQPCYHECYRFERAFFTFRHFLPYTTSCFFQGFPGRQQFNLKVSRASCWSSKHSPGQLFVWITAIHKRFIRVGST